MKMLKNIFTLPAVALTTFFLSTADNSFAADKYEVDRAHSSLGFKVSHMLIAKVSGSFSDFTVDLLFDEKEIAKSSVKTVIQSAGIRTGNNDRDNHLRSPDFFDVQKYPEIVFTSKKLVKKGGEYLLTGDFTMHGVSKQLEIPFQLRGPITDPWGNVRIGIEANLTLNRMDYGVSWSSTLDNGGLVVSNEVEIELSIEAVKAK